MYVPAENAGLTLRESRAGITRITRGRGLADYAEGDDGLGKLKASPDLMLVVTAERGRSLS